MTQAWFAPRLAMAAVVLAAACGTPPSATVERLEVRAEVLSGGAVEVIETGTVRFDAPGATYVRRVDGAWADAVTFESAKVDGAPLGADSPDLLLSVHDGDDLDVHVTAATPSPRAREISFAYRLDGAVALQGLYGTMTLPAIGPGTSAISYASVLVELPGDVPLLEGSGMAEEGWTVERRPRGLFAARHGLASSDAATAMARFEVEPGRAVEPAWQRHQQQARDFAPAFVAGGLFLLVIGFGVLWIVRLQFPKPAPHASTFHDRGEVRRGLRYAGVASMAVAVLTAGAAEVWLGYLGPWPLAVPSGLLVVGVLFLAVHRWWV